ncbi:MAG: SRPBCC domain-containing protein [Gammaproteobacteria bacterium]|nr:SRPBCC domain-containing protein [Gammaproteobacteria bacterium]
MQAESEKSNSVVFERLVFIGAPSNKVWEAITNPDIVNQYYLAPLAGIALELNGEIYYGMNDDRMIDGEILEIEDGAKLVHSFTFTHRPDDPPSRVMYELTPTDKMTALRLRHDQFPSVNGMFADINEGWDVILSSMKTLLETGKPLPWPTN